MGASGREFLQFRIESGYYNEIPEDIRQHMELKQVDVEEVDYSHDELWKELKQKSVKAYKELKNREYDLRHNFKK